jgi:hypothetical protein
MGRKESHYGRAFLATRRHYAAVESAFLLTLGAAAPAAHAAEVRVMSTVALALHSASSQPKYESSSGNKLIVVYSTIADLKKRIEAGETADVMILSRPALDDLQTQGTLAQAGCAGALAFSRTGDPATGEFEDAKVIRKFGDVPDDLSEL